MGFQRILIALERSPAADVLVQEGLALAQGHGGVVRLFHCLHVPVNDESEWLAGIGTLGDLELQHQQYQLQHQSLQKDIEAVEDWLARYGQWAADLGIACDWECRVGGTGRWICDRAQQWQADLVIMGRRGHQGLAEVLLGSVSNHVVHHAPCSVLVMQGKALDPG